ncbi:RICIN domain-containing protein [Streptomyces sp. NPDC002328]|uniref:RICIN domain-containing protein n=1 Tax=Streptomyces sp. NPDC002328 TaxID=3364642 RepID=UPI0036B3F1C2
MSDDALVAALRMSRTIEGTTPVAALIARHGPSVSDFAEICAPGSPAPARALAAAAFRQVVQALHKAGSTGALRPRLLVAVRDAAYPRPRDGVDSGPAYGRAAGTADGDAPPPHPVAENRRLGRAAFLRLPRTTQYVLWHMEVEAEPSAVPAALLGVEGDIPFVEWERAREQLRTALLRTHVEGSAGRECRDYSRLLDAPSHRAGSTLPEVQLHLDRCPYCRDAAEQLRLCAAEPGVLLAEALLGEGAHPYLAACRERPARTASVATATAGADAPDTDDPQTPQGSARRRSHGARRSGGKVFAVAGIAVSAAVVAAAVVLTGGPSSDDAAPSPGTQPPAPSAPPSSAPAGSTALPVPPGSGRLRNAAADLCMDVRGTPPRRGAEVTLSTCSTAGTQRWTHLENGMLRNFARQDLCLDAGGDDEVLDLEFCGSSGDLSFGLRFELSPKGELLTRDEGNLAVAPASPEGGSVLVPSPRNGESDQRWLVEPV